MSISFPPPPPPPQNDTSSATIAIIAIASAVIASVCLYLLFRFLFNRFHDRIINTFSNIIPTLQRRHSQPPPNKHQLHVSPNAKLLDSLPLFTFSSNLTGGGGDCAVCLSKFKKRDRLRLLPQCCHAFHAPCIDAWIVSSNPTCPLCRSKVFPSSPPENISRVGSFRVEIGSISRREGGGAAADQRSYAIGDGSLEYVVDHDNIGTYEVSAESSSTTSSSSSNNNSSMSLDKESEDVGIPVPAPPPGEVLARNASSTSWVIMDYIPILYRAVSLRSSGRFFSGSMRRTEDLEANRVGEEISEMFRWFSGF